jgi:sulfoxide reductase catalytic subunit YedY
MPKIRPSEITPEHVYGKKPESPAACGEEIHLNRRQFLLGVGALAVGLALGSCGGTTPPEGGATPDTTPPEAGAAADELGNELTPYDTVVSYNNFYEFSLDKGAVAGAARNFVTSPWEVAVGGLVRQPRTFAIEDLLALEQEERIYRMRCVEAWSMVIPWLGFPLHRLFELAEPTSEARYVRFETLLDPAQMPGEKSGVLDWPYVEGLRLDEAMHDLTLLATGLYGKALPPQDGAPIRLVVPWKYGFKSIKSIVRIDLVADMPVSAWMRAAPNEYGFYANVNPDVPHPRWSQATERRIGEFGQRDTLLFNGYEEQVADLYAGMDLKVNF